MPVTNTGVFPQGFAHDACVLTAAKTTYNDGTNAVLLSTAGANGSEYSKVAMVPRATCSATQGQLYAYDGTSYYLLATCLIQATTVNQTSAITPVPMQHVDGGYVSETNPLRLQSGWKLYAAIGVALAGGIVCNAQRKDY